MSVQFISNEIEDFVEGGGLYPGGTGVIEDIKYVLWDYDGKQPKDSVVAVAMTFQPSDGSNEGKPFVQHWSHGNAADFAPDPTGGFLVPLKTRNQSNDNTNWSEVLKAFRNACGLEKGKLSGTEKGKEGIKALIRTVVTLSRVDQKEREGLVKDVDPTKKKFKATILVPTKATFPWEKGAAKVATMKTPATTAPATPTTNGTAAATSSTIDLATIIKTVVEQSGGVMELSEIPKAVLGGLSDVPRDQRVSLTKEAKEVCADVAKFTALAEQSGWTFDGNTLMV